MRLVGDIGGTKALLGLARSGDGAPELVLRRRYACAGHDGVAGLLRHFIAETCVDPAAIADGCLGLAGPVADDGRSARMTNLPWTVDAEALRGELGTGPLRLINDFAAAALGIEAAGSECRTTLQAGEAIAAGVRVVIGAGTGLGVAVLVEDGGRWRVLPGEGGHVGFAPADETQAALWRHLHAKLGRVEYEDVVSGMGLAAIHDFLTLDPAQGVQSPAATPEEITARAAAHPEGSEARAVDIFLRIWGAYAGDLALALSARGGVFLAGGIAAHVLPQLRGGAFVEAFNAKRGHAGLARRMPVHVVNDPDLALKGAALADTLC